MTLLGRSHVTVDLVREREPVEALDQRGGKLNRRPTPEGGTSSRSGLPGSGVRPRATATTPAAQSAAQRARPPLRSTPGRSARARATAPSRRASSGSSRDRRCRGALRRGRPVARQTSAASSRALSAPVKSARVTPIAATDQLRVEQRALHAARARQLEALAGEWCPPRRTGRGARACGLAGCGPARGDRAGTRPGLASRSAPSSTSSTTSPSGRSRYQARYSRSSAASANAPADVKASAASARTAAARSRLPAIDGTRRRGSSSPPPAGRWSPTGSSSRTRASQIRAASAGLSRALGAARQAVGRIPARVVGDRRPELERPRRARCSRRGRHRTAQDASATSTSAARARSCSAAASQCSPRSRAGRHNARGPPPPAGADRGGAPTGRRHTRSRGRAHHGTPPSRSPRRRGRAPRPPARRPRRRAPRGGRARSAGRRPPRPRAPRGPRRRAARVAARPRPARCRERNLLPGRDARPSGAGTSLPPASNAADKLLDEERETLCTGRTGSPAREGATARPRIEPRTRQYRRSKRRDLDLGEATRAAEDNPGFRTGYVHVTSSCRRRRAGGRRRLEIEPRATGGGLRGGAVRPLQVVEEDGDRLPSRPSADEPRRKSVDEGGGSGPAVPGGVPSSGSSGARYGASEPSAGTEVVGMRAETGADPGTRAARMAPGLPAWPRPRSASRCRRPRGRPARDASCRHPPRRRRARDPVAVSCPRRRLRPARPPAPPAR